jgi:ketopantoate reductase
MSIHTMVVGGGALGSILAAHLGRSGERVTLVARGKRADHLEREDGEGSPAQIPTSIQTKSAHAASARDNSASLRVPQQ